MKIVRFIVLLLATLSFATPGVRAVTLEWDTNTAFSGAQGGTGNWPGTTFWWNAAVNKNVSWVSGAAASFGPSAGTVTVISAVTADSLSFSTTGYAISGSSTLILSGADTIGVANSSDTVTISAPIGGTAGFTKTGAGTLTFSGSTANSYSGSATVADGTLNLSKTAGVNAIAGNLTIGDGSGAASSAIVTQGANNQISDTATVTINIDGLWNLASGNRSETIGGLVMNNASIATGTGVLTLNGNVGGYGGSISGSLDLGGATRTITDNDLASLDISAGISNGGLTKAGDGLLTLSGTSANTYTGITTVSGGGQLILNKPAGVAAVGGNLVVGDGMFGGVFQASVKQMADGQISSTATVTVAADGSWDLFNHAQTIAGLTLAGGDVGIGTLTINGNIAATAGGTFDGGHLNLGGINRTIDVSSGELGCFAIISNGGIIKTGAGALHLYQVNTFTGPVVINGGTVQVQYVADSGISSSLGTGSSIPIDGATFEYAGLSDGSTNRDVTLNSGGGTVSVIATKTLTMSGTFSGTGALTKTGPGTLVLNGANSYAGNTTVQAGALWLGTATLADASDVSLLSGATLDLAFTGIDVIHSLFINGVSQYMGTWGAIGSGAEFSSSLITGTGRLHVTVGPLAGDFNGNGTVDVADYIVWRKGLGTTYTQSDYDVWRAHFGQTAGAGTALAAVPEPSGLFLIANLILFAATSARRRIVFAARL